MRTYYPCFRERMVLVFSCRASVRVVRIGALRQSCCAHTPREKGIELLLHR